MFQLLRLVLSMSQEFNKGSVLKGEYDYEIIQN